MTFVNMERIEKRFNNQSVLRDVSLKMNRGEIVSMVQVNPHFYAAWAS